MRRHRRAGRARGREETPKAFVTLKPGATLDAAAPLAVGRARLAPFKAPRDIAFGDLPKMSAGQTQKDARREREWQGYEKRIH